MKNRKQLTLFFVSIFTLMQGFSSCESLGDNPVAPASQIIVEGYLIPNQPVSIQVTEPSPFGTDSTLGVSDLQISLMSSSGRKLNLTHTKNGIYVSKPDEIIEGAGTKYTLSFQYGDKEIRAVTTIPQKPKQLKASATQLTISQTKIEIDDSNVIGIGGSTGSGNSSRNGNTLSLSWLNVEANYHTLNIQNLTPNPESIQVLPPGFILDLFVGQIPPNQRNWITISSDQFQSYGRHALILIRLNTDYVALFDTENSNSLNIKTPTSLITNGLGIFTGINSDTLYVDILKK